MKTEPRTVAPKVRFGSTGMRDFQKLGSKVLSVPREEIQRREAAYRAEGRHKRGKA